MFRQLGAGVDQFDPENYDPSLAQRYNNAAGGDASGAVISAKPGQKMQVNLVLNNPTTQTLTFELFAYIDSCTKRLKREYQVGAYTYIPLLSYEGITSQAAGTGGTVGWNQDGDLQIHGNDAATPANPVASISCGEIPYRSFFDASGITPFQVAYIRQTVTTDPQIDKNLVWFQRSYSGGQKENRIAPRAYFKPNQYQNYTIDLTVSFTIAIDSGLRIEVLPGESVRFAFFIQMWTDQALQ